MTLGDDTTITCVAREYVACYKTLSLFYIFVATCSISAYSVRVPYYIPQNNPRINEKLISLDWIT